MANLDRRAQVNIIKYLDTRITGNLNPHRFGSALTGPLRGLWRYRVGDYRIICEIKRRKLIVLAVSIGHRREIYR